MRAGKTLRCPSALQGEIGFDGDGDLVQMVYGAPRIISLPGSALFATDWMVVDEPTGSPKEPTGIRKMAADRLARTPGWRLGDRNPFDFDVMSVDPAYHRQAFVDGVFAVLMDSVMQEAAAHEGRTEDLARRVEALEKAQKGGAAQPEGEGFWLRRGGKPYAIHNDSAVRFLAGCGCGAENEFELPIGPRDALICRECGCKMAPPEWTRNWQPDGRP